MAHTYDELHKMTVAGLREVAEAQDSDDLTGYKSLKKAELLGLVCKVLGVDAHEHDTARGIDKAAIKAGQAMNIGIVSAYNDMLSAHQPYGRYPEQIKIFARERGATTPALLLYVGMLLR